MMHFFVPRKRFCQNLWGTRSYTGEHRIHLNSIILHIWLECNHDYCLLYIILHIHSLPASRLLIFPLDQARLFFANAQDGATMLISAAENGHTDCVRLLLENIANVEAKNEVRRMHEYINDLNCFDSLRLWFRVQAGEVHLCEYVRIRACVNRTESRRWCLPLPMGILTACDCFWRAQLTSWSKMMCVRRDYTILQ